MKTQNKTSFYVFGLFLLAAFILWKAIFWRINHTYMEDDLVWFFPVIDHLLSEKNSFLALLKSFHLPELTLFDGVYFSALRAFFGYNFSLYPLPSFFIHLINGIILYKILRQPLRCSIFTSGLSSLIYLTFYGHYHAYLWPMAMHHTLGVFWILFFVNEYLSREVTSEKKSRETARFDLRLYGLAFLASFMRFSILIIPLLIGTQMFLTSCSKRDFYLKIKRWLPVFILISWYQATVFLSGNRPEILSDFLKTENLLLVSGLILLLLFLVKKNVQRIYFFWLLIPVGFILCFYLWLFPKHTLTPANVALRWQVMPFPAEINLRIFLLAVSWGIMYAFTRHLREHNNHFGIFVVWYILLFPYLAFRLSEMPSRYLIYLSPVFASVLSVFMGEIIFRRLRESHKNIFRLGICSLAILFAAKNIQAIHERSIRSFLTDYRWKYDDILAAEYMKQNRIDKEDSDKRQICIRGAYPLSYLMDWGREHLKKQTFDGYESLRIVVASVLAVPKEAIKINGECSSTETPYDFQNIDVLSRFRWPVRFEREDAWELYGKSFDGDKASLRIDAILQAQTNRFKSGKEYWFIRQGRYVETYGHFDIYSFKKWYFAIPQGEFFNLARLKFKDYPQSFYARTKHELRRMISETVSYDRSDSTVFLSKRDKENARSISQGKHRFRMTLLGAPVGFLTLTNDEVTARTDKKLIRASIELKPWVWLQKISGDRIGFVIKSLLGADDLLPVEFEQLDLMKLRKGKDGRKIVYHHADRFMERRGYKEDIEFNTRDPVALILWILSKDYSLHTRYETTFNIGKSLFTLELVPVFIEKDKILLKLKIKSLGEKKREHNWFMMVKYKKEEKRTPQRITLRAGLANFSITLLSNDE